MQKSLRTPRQILLQSLLVEARKAKGLTQAELAEALNKPQSFVAKYENGERRIDVVEFVDITSALGVSTADFLARIEPVVIRSRQPGD
ncbi:XRE family transcriptional regulator [Kaistia algarum]|uniref:helix-turn-helix domain-containing protein n=1 Tax=Kaistia algarum TaxID=2083279 RepID=UPI000CE83999|nr:helix-turn-helix transcriptional regulator [Kaistia algarum]MCX5512874.1 helix-turn-helix transcriptional regulator [Kaistia algarum]PPE81634.1 XRE family transcriptional regulator [Kaistia algarum]